MKLYYLKIELAYLLNEFLSNILKDAGKGILPKPTGVCKLLHRHLSSLENGGLISFGDAADIKRWVRLAGTEWAEYSGKIGYPVPKKLGEKGGDPADVFSDAAMYMGEFNTENPFWTGEYGKARLAYVEHLKWLLNGENS